MKLAFAFIALAAAVGFTAAPAKAQDQSPGASPGSYYANVNGQYSLVTPQASSSAPSAPASQQSRPRDDWADQGPPSGYSPGPMMQTATVGCNPPPPAGLSVYAVNYNGCTVWCRTGLAALFNPPFCSGPAAYDEPYYAPYYPYYRYYGRPLIGLRFGGWHGGRYHR